MMGVKTQKTKSKARAAKATPKEKPATRLEELEAEFERRDSRSALGGGEAAIARQHSKGNLTAMERMDVLFDEGTFRRLFSLRGENNTGDGVVAGWGLVNGRKAYAYGWDFTNFAGTCSSDNGLAISEIINSARREHCPLVSLNDSGGARVQDAGFAFQQFASGRWKRRSRVDQSRHKAYGTEEGRLPHNESGRCAGGTKRANSRKQDRFDAPGSSGSRVAGRHGGPVCRSRGAVSCVSRERPDSQGRCAAGKWRASL